MSDIRVELTMDLSNFARGNNSGVASIKRLKNAIDEVQRCVDGRPSNLHLVADHSLFRAFPANERSQYDKLVTKYQVSTTPTGVQADYWILDWAEECFVKSGRYGIVLSQDGFWQTEFSRYHHWLYEPGAGRLFGGTPVGKDGSWRLVERFMRVGGPAQELPRSRTLEGFLDQAFPTPRSIAREMKISLDDVDELIIEIGLARSESEILQEDAAAELRKYFSSVQKFTSSVMDLGIATGINTTDVVRWLDAEGFSYLLRGERPFVDEVTAAKINDWTQTPSGTIGRYWLRKAVIDKSSQDITLALAKLGTTHDNGALKIGTLCGQLIDNGRVKDWSLLSGLTQLDAIWLSSLLKEAQLILDLDVVPKKWADKLPGNLRLLKIGRDVHAQISDENIADYFDLLNSIVPKTSGIEFDFESNESFQLVTEALLSQLTAGSSTIAQETWRHISNVLILLAPENDVSFVANYMCGNLELALVEGTGCSLKTRNMLRRRFFAEHLDSPWLPASVFRDIAKSPVKARQLIAGDLTPLLDCPEFSEAARRSVEEVFASTSPAAALASSLVAKGTLDDVVSELSGLRETLSNVLNSRNGIGNEH